MGFTSRDGNRRTLQYCREVQGTRGQQLQNSGDVAGSIHSAQVVTCSGVQLCHTHVVPGEFLSLRREWKPLGGEGL